MIIVSIKFSKSYPNKVYRSLFKNTNIILVTTLLSLQKIFHLLWVKDQNSSHASKHLRFSGHCLPCASTVPGHTLLATLRFFSFLSGQVPVFLKCLYQLLATSFLCLTHHCPVGLNSSTSRMPCLILCPLALPSLPPPPLWPHRCFPCSQSFSSTIRVVPNLEAQKKQKPPLTSRCVLDLAPCLACNRQGIPLCGVTV